MVKGITRSGPLCRLMAVVTIFCAIRAVPAVVYTVGDASGWSMGGDYGTWTSGKIFNVGDTLVFNYSPGHTVDEVTEKDYKSCTTANSLSSDSTGATSITLSTAGPHYFICGVPGHCSGGMKISINVAAGAPTPSGTTTSPPSTTTSPPSTTTTYPSPPATGTLTRDQPTSSSEGLSPAVALLISTFCIVLFKSFAW